MSISASLVLQNANVITCDPARPVAEAVAVNGDRILLVGSNNEAALLKSADTRVIDCQGYTLVPGFNDAHCHFFPFVRKLFSLDLSPASVRSIADIQEVIRRKAISTPEGTWITGTDYNEFYLSEKRHPTRWDLDQVAPRHPVLLVHRTLHACVLNSLALSLAGITFTSEAPEGGVIDRDLTSGEPNGILFEMLGWVRENVLPPLSITEIEYGIEQANRLYLSQGITSFGEATVSNDLKQWYSWRKLKEAGKLQSRIYLMPGSGFLDQFKEAGLVTGAGDFDLKVGCLKIVLSKATGQLQPSREELFQTVAEAVRSGFQVAIHAIERSAVAAAVSALEYALKVMRVPPTASLPAKNRPAVFPAWRPRIEHCSECSPDLRQRLSKLEAVIVTQPPFVYYSGERYLAQVSAETRQWLYPFRSLLDAGLVVAGSSDSPVVPHNPLVGIYAATTRYAESGQPVLASEALTVRQALEMYTVNAAYASFEEKVKGSLSPGQLADIVMLDTDLLHSHPENIRDISVIMTILGGKIVWEA